MKLSLALGKTRVLDRQAAWGCFTANLAAPGCGTLYAGKPVGYAQLAFTVIGFALTTIFGMKTLVWFSQEYPKWQQSIGEGSLQLHEMWLNLRWPLLGVALFLAGFLWSMASSLQIFMEASKTPPETTSSRPLPPKL